MTALGGIAPLVGGHSQIVGVAPTRRFNQTDMLANSS